MTSNLTNTKIELGKRGEAIAASFYESQGFQIVAKNFRCKFGELDLVVKKKEHLVFVEVKTRSRLDFEYQLLPPLKILRLRKAISIFLCGRESQMELVTIRLELAVVTQDRVVEVLPLACF